MFWLQLLVCVTPKLVALCQTVTDTLRHARAMDRLSNDIVTAQSELDFFMHRRMAWHELNRWRSRYDFLLSRDTFAKKIKKRRMNY